MPRKTELTVQSTKIPKSWKRELDRFARKKGWTASQFVKVAIARYLEELKGYK